MSLSCPALTIKTYGQFTCR